MKEIERGIVCQGEAMATVLTTFEVPLRVDADGVIRVGATHVTLDLVLDYFKQGISPEAIVQKLPAITRTEVYGAITYYLQHQAEIEAYLRQGEAEADRIRRELEDWFNPVGLRAKLVARLEGGK